MTAPMSSALRSIFKDRLLDGKVAFVTGRSSGICQRMAERFAEHGAKVAILARNQEKLDAAVAAISAGHPGTSIMGFSADVRDYAAVDSALEKTRDLYGPIDILIAGAAGNFPAPALGMSSNGFKAVMDIDLLGTFNTCRAAHQYLKKPGASIIAISAAFPRLIWPALSAESTSPTRVDAVSNLAVARTQPAVATRYGSSTKRTCRPSDGGCESASFGFSSSHGERTWIECNLFP